MYEFLDNYFMALRVATFDFVMIFLVFGIDVGVFCM